MSNLFEVLKKDKAIDLVNLDDTYNGDHSRAGMHAVSPARTATPASSRPEPAGRIERLKVSTLGPLFPFQDGQNQAAEQYRIIRTKILHGSKKPQFLIVSSASSGDGKTVTSINLAASLALKKSFSVLLVDADLRRPRVASELGIAQTPGFADVLCGRAGLEQALVRAGQIPALSVLPAGQTRENPAELFDSERFSRLMDEMRSRFDMVVFDTTPAEIVADYELLEKVCDAMVIVIRPGHTSRKASSRLLKTAPKDKLLGIVLNGVEDWLFWQTPAYRYYTDLAMSESATE